jgi:hypothetical protein
LGHDELVGRGERLGEPVLEADGRRVTLDDDDTLGDWLDDDENELLPDVRTETLLELEINGDDEDVNEPVSGTETVCVALALPDVAGERVVLGDGVSDDVEDAEVDGAPDFVVLDVAVDVLVDVAVAVDDDVWLVDELRRELNVALTVEDPERE